MLVVDDEEHTRVALSLLLTKGGFTPTVFDRGADALRAIFAAAASSRPFALLVLDIQMPGVTGFDILQQLEAHEVTVPVLIISGHRYREVMEGFDYRGHLEYLEKPFEPHVFLQFLRRLLQAR